MNYHTIKYDDMLNGDGLRVVLFVSGCNHHCKNCQNPQTWDPNSGKPFTEKELNDILEYLKNDYAAGLTITGGDPLHPLNAREVYNICKAVKEAYPNKTIWLYTGYTYEQIVKKPFDYITDMTNIDSVLVDKYVDVLVDGKYVESLADTQYHWAGSTNQRVLRLK